MGIKILFGGCRVESLKTLLILDFIKKIDIITFENCRLKQFLKILGSNSKIGERSIIFRSKKETLNLLDKRLENSYDIFLSVGFPYVIPSEILEKFKKTIFLNLHPHILPKWKGYNVIKESFLSGEKYFGATLHYMTEKVDEGKIIYQVKFYLERPSLEEIYDLTFSIAEPICLFNGLQLLLKSWKKPS